MKEEVQALSSLHQKHLECRDLRHAWKASLTFQYSPRTIGRKLQCTRCKALRYQFIDRRTGRIVLGSRYAYPEGYILKGYGMIKSADVRVAVVDRLNGTKLPPPPPGWKEPRSLKGKDKQNAK